MRCSPSNRRWQKVEEALKTAMITYIQLGNAERNVKPNRKKVIEILEKCFTYGDCNLVRFDKLYDRLMTVIATDVKVTVTNGRIEQQRFL